MNDPAAKTERVISRYRRLWDDYFPTSQHSSTPVKLTACLTEAAALWDADGGAIMLDSAGGAVMEVAAVRGAGLPNDTRVTPPPGSFIQECFSRGKLETVESLPEGTEILPGIPARSAVCLPVLSGASVKGVFLLYSRAADHFLQPDLATLALFASYAAVLLEVDELGERLGEHLVIDPLTGLHNRREFDRRLRDETLRAGRYSINLSLVIFDVDDLESYNNSCGYMLGNLALSDIAGILKKGVREVDFAARVGSDEFAIILPETTRIGALRFADRMRAQVASYPFPGAGDREGASLTVSAGIANFPNPSTDDLVLLENAYAALELARKEGPDNIKLWGETPRDGAKP